MPRKENVLKHFEDQKSQTDTRVNADIEKYRKGTLSLAVGDSNWARSANVKNHVFLDCQVCRASAQLHFPHQKSTIFNTWIVRRSFCNKFIARQGKSTDNTLCIIEHFDVVLRRICRKNRTPFESPTANAKYT